MRNKQNHIKTSIFFSRPKNVLTGTEQSEQSCAINRIEQNLGNSLFSGSQLGKFEGTICLAYMKRNVNGPNNFFYGR